MADPSSNATDYASLTTRILAHYDPGPHFPSIRDFVAGLVSELVDPPLAKDHADFLTLILSLTFDEFYKARNFVVNEKKLHLGEDPRQGGTKDRVGLYYKDSKTEIHVILEGREPEEGENWEDGVRAFLEEVEMVGRSELEIMEANDVDAKGNEVDD
ncbi:hypothetical protein IQ06DRAFT_18377 [Phaeosphaeriaceae sp. SRC1lsM3a]|nr:hypothetical protein IQ06DRAFT_18377 [Stagonospora sp. SRC1lsM3a]